MQFVALFIMQCAWTMEYSGCSQSANAVVSLKELAVLCVAKHCLAKDHQKILQLPIELKESLASLRRWERMSQDSFPIIPLSVKYAAISPDTSTIAGVAKDPDGTCKLRFITISEERADKSRKKFPEEMFSSADDERIVHVSWHPIEQRLAFAGGRTPNVVCIETAENNLMNNCTHYTSERTRELKFLQWNPQSDILLAAGNKIIFIIPRESNQQVEEIVYDDNHVITAASWSESGKRILVKKGLFEVEIIDCVNRWVNFSLFVRNEYTPIVAVEWDDEDSHTILLAGSNIIQQMSCKSGRLHDIEYVDCSSIIEQILRLNKRYLLIKTRQENKCLLKILDRLQKKIFNLSHVVCDGTLKLSTNKRFVYGSHLGDSLVDLSYLLDNYGTI